MKSEDSQTSFLVFSGITKLRQSVLGTHVGVVFVVALAIGTVLLVGSYRALTAVSEHAIDQATAHTVVELDKFFEPVQNDAKTLEGWGRQGAVTISYDQIEALNARLIPVIENLPQVSSILLADTEGHEYLLLRDGSGWKNRFVDESWSADKVRWVQWDAQGNEIERWDEQSDYRSGDRPWYQGAIHSEEGEPFWTDPYTFFTTGDPGITLSRRYRSPQGTQIVAFDVLLTEVAAKTASMQPTENGYVSVLTNDGEVLGLPARQRYDDREAILEDVLSRWEDLGLVGLGQAWTDWRGAGRDADVFLSASDDTGKFWVGFQPFELGNQSLAVATVVPRVDLTGQVDRQRNLAIGLGILGVLLAVGISLRTSRRYEKRVAQAYEEAERFGQYYLVEKLGAGGMGEVYRAEHEMLKRPTALKLLKPDLYDEHSIKRFEREVQLSCRLQHPNTVTIFDYGRTEEGLFYYAMELLDGVTLDVFSEYTGPLDQARVVYLMRQICGALCEAHGMGLLHRDIKPSNVMIGNFGGKADRITVLDYGLVKDIHTPDRIKLTNQEYLQGSPGFMAPEIILGEAAESPAVDIFSVGAVAYSLLCGQNPFSGPSPVKILMSQVEEEPPRPSQVLEHPIDADLEALIMACLNKKAAQRPASMHEVYQRLGECECAGQWHADDARKWWEEFGGHVVPETGGPEELSKEEAYGETLSVTSERKALATRDGEPPEVMPVEKVEG